MRISMAGLFGASVVLIAAAGPARAQAVALPLRGEGQLALRGTVREVEQGAVLLQADSIVKLVFLQSGVPRTVLSGLWRMTDASTARVAVHRALGSSTASGAGEIRFRPDGSVDHLMARGRAGGRAFSLRFDNALSVAAGPEAQVEEEDGLARRGDRAVVDVVRHGEGRLTDAAGRELWFDRARLILGENDELQLVLQGDTRAEFSGTWEGDPRDSPIHLELREAMGEKVGGMGQAWLRERRWDRDWSFNRVELDGWSEEGGWFRLYFQAE